MRSVNFLSAGPTFSIGIAEKVDVWRAPSLVSALNWGSGPRSVAAEPLTVDAAAQPGLPAPEGEVYSVVERVDTASGYAEILDRPDGLAWGLRWRVGNFELSTHVRAEEGRDTVGYVLRNLNWNVQPESSLPIAAIGGGIRLAVAEFPGHQETISFQRAAAEITDLGGAVSISLRRPSSLGLGSRLVPYSDPATTMSRIGLGGGIDVIVTSVGDRAQTDAYGEVDEILSAAL